MNISFGILLCTAIIADPSFASSQIGKTNPIKPHSELLIGQFPFTSNFKHYGGSSELTVTTHGTDKKVGVYENSYTCSPTARLSFAQYKKLVEASGPKGKLVATKPVARGAAVVLPFSQVSYFNGVLTCLYSDPNNKRLKIVITKKDNAGNVTEIPIVESECHKGKDKYTLVCRGKAQSTDIPYPTQWIKKTTHYRIQRTGTVDFVCSNSMTVPNLSLVAKPKFGGAREPGTVKCLYDLYHPHTDRFHAFFAGLLNEFRSTQNYGGKKVPTFRNAGACLTTGKGCILDACEYTALDFQTNPKVCTPIKRK